MNVHVAAIKINLNLSISDTDSSQLTRIMQIFHNENENISSFIILLIQRSCRRQSYVSRLSHLVAKKMNK